MGIFSWLRKSSDETTFREVTVRELCRAASELAVQKLAFAVCVNMTANALGQATFRTFENGKEVRGDDFYTWNVQPNPNESAASFWRRTVRKMMQEGEALQLVRRVGQTDDVWLADSFTLADKRQAFAPNVWQDIYINGQRTGASFDERVLHYTLSAMRPDIALAGIAAAESELIGKIQKAANRGLGQHIKVHIDRMAQGSDEFENSYLKMVNQQLQPFFNAENAVLPEFEGYKYEYFSGSENTAIPEFGREMRKMIDDVFTFTARAFLIPPVLVCGEVADSKDAFQRWLTVGIDPLARVIESEINRKCYGAGGWRRGDYLRVDTSGIQHFDMFSNADAIAKLAGSGYSYNDIQRAIGGAEVDADWANEHYFTKNYATVSEMKGGGTE